MTIPYTVVSGVDTSFSTHLNSNFEYVNEEIYSRDITAVGTSSTAVTNLKVVGVPANTFSRLMNINCGYQGNGATGSVNGSYAVISLLVNGSTIITASSNNNTTNPSDDSISGSWLIPFRLTDVALTSSINITVTGQQIINKGTAVTGAANCTYLVVSGM